MSDESSNCTYYLRIVKLIVDIGTETVRTLFYHFKPRSRVQKFFQSQTICDELNDLRRCHRLTRKQYERLVLGPDPNPDEFDLSLLLTLLTNLFKQSICAPLNGWDKDVDANDTTLGGDLLRLKDIRNKMVGHRPNVELSSSEFEELWTETENVLMRITEFVDSTKKHELAAKVSDYKTSALDATSERKYMSLLNAWHEEASALLSHLKEEVEVLCKNAEGFDIFFRSKIPDRYLRYILLLCEGGLSVLAGVMNRELEKHQTSLSDILMQNRQTLIASNINAISTVFTEDGKIITDISSWGGKLLSDVILTLFRTNVTKGEKTAISTIGTSCNDYEKIAMESLDSDRFFRMYLTDLVSSIKVLAYGLDSKTQSECMLLIMKHNYDKIDEDAAKGYLMQLRRGCEPFQSLVEQYIELREKFKRTVEQMQREGACFGTDQDDENQKGLTSSVSIKFGCPSTGDTKIVNYLLQRNETLNSINQIAEALSEQLNENISISTSVKACGILITNSDPLIMVSKSQWTHFLPSTGVSLQEQVPEALTLYSRRNQNKFSQAQQPPTESAQQATAQPAQQPKSNQFKAQQLPAQQQRVQSAHQSLASQEKKNSRAAITA